MSAKATMQEVIKSHNVIHVATLDGKGVPCVRVVDYAAGDEENIAYFMTRNVTRKVEQIRQNPTVGFAVDRDVQGVEELSKSKYIKGTAIAGIVEDPAEQKKAIGLLLAKFPFLADLPFDPADFVVIRLTLKNVLVSDNSTGFGHTEEVIF